MNYKYYIAYGSNLNMAQMVYRCPQAFAIGTAMLHGYRLIFRGSKTGAYLTIESDRDSEVPVGIWAVSEADERSLDRYEGFPTFYQKKTLEINMEDFHGRFSTVKAMVYTMRKDAKAGLPTDQYMKTCMDGYDDFNLPLGYLSSAMDETREAIERGE